MVDNGGNPQSINLVTLISSQNIPRLHLQFWYFWSAIQFFWVFHFFGFRSPFFTSLMDLEYGNRNPSGLGQYFLNFAPVKRAPRFLFNISQFSIYVIKLNSVQVFRGRMNFHVNYYIRLTYEIWLVQDAYRCFKRRVPIEFLHC